MKSFVYILQCNNGSYYIGSTKNLDERLKKHDCGRVKSTKNCRPFIVKYTEEYDEYKLAFRREKQLKSWKSRKAIEKLFEHNYGSIV